MFEVYLFIEKLASIVLKSLCQATLLYPTHKKENGIMTFVRKERKNLFVKQLVRLVSKNPP